ncbi:MAG: dephospho-CoA kinase [Bacillota bacterium]|nr:dephospho-CoA kinase [Bacillota bacterium]
MLVAGLTGGIGAGKSTAAEYFVEKGFYHIDADRIGHTLTADGMPVLDVLAEVFAPGGEHNPDGIEIMEAPGKLNRRAMAKVAFRSEENCQVFDEIMFTAIILEIEIRIDEIKDHSDRYTGILIDAPLLFESGANELCDVVILVTADEEERIMRVAIRDKATREEIMNRINSQMDDELKIKLADYVVDNSGSIEDLYGQLDEVLESMMQ